MWANQNTSQARNVSNATRDTELPYILIFIILDKFLEKYLVNLHRSICMFQNYAHVDKEEYERGGFRFTSCPPSPIMAPFPQEVTIWHDNGKIFQICLVSSHSVFNGHVFLDP